MSKHLAHPAGSTRDSELLRTGFQVDAESADATVLLRLQGELDMATAVELRRAVGEAISGLPQVIVADASRVTFVDSTGIGVLVGGSRRAQAAGCSFVVRSPSRSVLKALRLTGLDQVLDIEADPLLN
jgi:anti-sigma B factor antagonist